MRFKDFIKESIIDIPRKTYARGVFDKADTPNPVLSPSVKKQVLDGIKTFEKFGKVVKYTLIGSILTKQYRELTQTLILISYLIYLKKQNKKIT